LGGLSINLAAVAYGDDVDQALSVENTIHHAPIAHADTPEVAGALEFRDSGRAGISD